MHDIIVIGGGPAGLTAALYAKRSGKSVLVLEKEGYGGQIAFSPRVENYPGICKISGEELAENMLDQILALDVDTDVVSSLLPPQATNVKHITAPKKNAISFFIVFSPFLV